MRRLPEPLPFLPDSRATAGGFAGPGAGVKAGARSCRRRACWVVMSSRLEFREVGGSGIVAVVDGVEVTTLDGGDWDGLGPDEAQIVARMLQGWEPPPLDYDPEEHGDEIVPVEGAPGWYGYSPSRVPLRLPGGSEPEINSFDLDDFRALDGVPVAGCSCGGGVGCAALYARVAYRGRGAEVWWTIGDRPYVFPWNIYDGAIRQLLELTGEAPLLIDERPAS
jgi:hypothetical protein